MIPAPTVAVTTRRHGAHVSRDFVPYDGAVGENDNGGEPTGRREAGQAMVKTFIVPLDGSPVAESALEPAVRLAHAFEADLHLLSSTVGGHVEKAQDYLEGIARGVAAFDGMGTNEPAVLRDVTVETAGLVWPAPAIVQALESIPDSALCMATHGRGGLGRLALGSVADEVVGDAGGPIVLVGPEAKLTEIAGLRMVVCWKDINIEPDLFATAKEWAQALGLQVSVLHVRRPKVDGHGPATFSEWQESRHRVAEEFAASGLSAGVVIVDGHDVAEEILRFARTTPTALIAMGCRRHRPRRQGPLDSVALKTVRHAPCPILVQSTPISEPAE